MDDMFAMDNSQKKTFKTKTKQKHRDQLSKLLEKEEKDQLAKQGRKK